MVILGIVHGIAESVGDAGQVCAIQRYGVLLPLLLEPYVAQVDRSVGIGRRALRIDELTRRPVEPEREEVNDFPALLAARPETQLNRTRQVHARADCSAVVDDRLGLAFGHVPVQEHPTAPIPHRHVLRAADAARARMRVVAAVFIHSANGLGVLARHSRTLREVVLGIAVIPIDVHALPHAVEAVGKRVRRS